MEFPVWCGMQFPAIMYNAAMALLLIEETALSVVNLLLGRGWNYPTWTVANDSADWLQSGREDGHARAFDPSDILAEEIREYLPVVNFDDVSNLFANDDEVQCSVCLCNFMGGEEVRQTPRCSHIFHKDCLDRWLGHSQTTCPLCRSSLASDELIENRKQIRQVDPQVAADLARWWSRSSSHTRSGRGWWQGYFHGLPQVIDGLH